MSNLLKKSNYLLLGVALLFLSACETNAVGVSDVQLESIRLTMSFRPDVQFAPMYVAVSQGYAADEGLDIEFNHMPETEAVQLVGVAGVVVFWLPAVIQVLQNHQGRSSS